MGNFNKAKLLLQNRPVEEIQRRARDNREFKADQKVVASSSSVASVFGRTGAVSSANGDYAIQQITMTLREINDTNTNISATDFIVAYTALSTGRTATLPAASSMADQLLIVKDEAGNANTNNITVARSGSNTIDGATSKVINTSYGVLRLYSNGTNWFTI